MLEPAYTFTLPSLADETVLDCRIYHPPNLLVPSSSGESSPIKGAIFAHPYAALGGSFDDHVVLTAVKTLVKSGWVVGTFNFRGAAKSAGHSTWTGHAEQDDYATLIGFIIHYIQNLSQKEPSFTIPNQGFLSPTISSTQITVRLLLGGYSYGSLVLARLPPPAAILTRLQTAEFGSSDAEIILRARTLSRQTTQAAQQQEIPLSPAPRGRAMKSVLSLDSTAENVTRSSSHRVPDTPVTMGGEEPDSRGHSSHHHERLSLDLVRRSVAETPKRIVRSHVRTFSGRRQRHHSGTHMNKDDKESGEFTPPSPVTPGTPMSSTPEREDIPLVEVSYLLVSPVLLPFTHTLCPPGASFAAAATSHHGIDVVAGSQFLCCPTLAIFGSADGFTSNRRLRAWAEKQAADSTKAKSEKAGFEWSMIEPAGHFWREDGALKKLKGRIEEWVNDDEK